MWLGRMADVVIDVRPDSLSVRRRAGSSQSTSDSWPILVHQVVHELVPPAANRDQEHAWHASRQIGNLQVTSTAGDYESRGCRFESCRARPIFAGHRLKPLLTSLR
jgi:hypothetical protein